MTVQSFFCLLTSCHGHFAIASESFATTLDAHSGIQSNDVDLACHAEARRRRINSHLLRRSFSEGGTLNGLSFLLQPSYFRLACDARSNEVADAVSVSTAHDITAQENASAH
jgi:hypothetical protein